MNEIVRHLSMLMRLYGHSFSELRSAILDVVAYYPIACECDHAIQPFRRCYVSPCRCSGRCGWCGGCRWEADAGLHP